MSAEDERQNARLLELEERVRRLEILVRQLQALVASP